MNTPHEFGALNAGLTLLRAQNFASGAALATLTRTFGSTFRRAGARMLVIGDGTIVRGLSGGCPEADIIARAQDVIQTGVARIVRYNRETGLDALMELGCGGELEVLIEPLVNETALQFADAAADCLAQRRRGVLATVFAADGQCLEPAPRRLVWRDGIIVDSTDSAALSAAVAELAQAAQPGAPRVETVAVDGVVYEVLIETLIPPHALSIIGNNAGATALAKIGAGLGWAVTLVDHRDAPQWPGDLPPQIRCVSAGPETITSTVPLDNRSSAVVMTHNLARDIDYISALAPSTIAYLGAIGSRQRSRKLLDACMPQRRVHAPAGLDVGSETPEEIALAIAAEILAVTNGRGAQPLGDTNGPIH